MIPRFAPTYTYLDIFNSMIKGFSYNSNRQLVSYIKDRYHCKHVFLFNRARVALYYLLRALDYSGNVIVPAYNSICVPETILYAGYKIVFVDIAQQSINMSVDEVRKLDLDEQSVIIPTHTFGIPCELWEIVQIARKKHWFIVEDAAPAFGAEYQGELVGSIGDAAIISFQHHKVISAETGGILLIKNDVLGEKVAELMKNAYSAKDNLLLFFKSLGRKIATTPFLYTIAYNLYRFWKNEEMYEVVSPKTTMPRNFEKSCSSFSGALIFSQIDRLESNLNNRKRHAEHYLESLKDHPAIKIPIISKDSSPAWNQFPIFVSNKGHFYKYMQKHGIDITWTHRYSCAESFGLKGYPNTLYAAKSIVGLPLNPWLKNKQIEYTCSVVKKYKENE